MYMHEKYCVCMTVYMNTSQDDRVSQNAKLLFRRVCVSPDWGVAEQQYRLRCSTLPQEMKTMGLLYCGSLVPRLSPESWAGPGNEANTVVHVSQF